MEYNPVYFQIIDPGHYEKKCSQNKKGVFHHREELLGINKTVPQQRKNQTCYEPPEKLINNRL
jgi:hypothetical protein